MSAPHRNPAEDPLQSILDDLRRATEGAETSVGDALAELEQVSFSTVLVLMALVTITPLSGIPTVPTISAVVISFVTGQWLIGRSHLWLPGWILRRRISSNKAAQAIDWLVPAARFIDRHQRARLTVFTRTPLNRLALLVILGVVLTWPFLELLPFFTTGTAIGIALVAIGLMTRDGLWVLGGYSYFGALAGLILWLI